MESSGEREEEGKTQLVMIPDKDLTGFKLCEEREKVLWCFFPWLGFFGFGGFGGGWDLLVWFGFLLSVIVAASSYSFFFSFCSKSLALVKTKMK